MKSLLLVLQSTIKLVYFFYVQIHFLLLCECFHSKIRMHVHQIKIRNDNVQVLKKHQES